MSLDSLITDNSLRFEEALLKNKDNETLWLDYFEACGDNFERAAFILDRAVTELPGSTLLWNAYLLLPWGAERRPELIALYRRALSILRSTPSYWLEYIKLLQSDKDRDSPEMVASALDMALFNLDKSYHGTVWKAYIDLVPRLKDADAARVLIRYFECGEMPDGPTFSRDTCVLRVAEAGLFKESIAMFYKLYNTRPSTSESNSRLVIDLIGLLSSLSFSDAATVEGIASMASRDQPSQRSRVCMKVATYYSLRNETEKARHCHSVALKSATSALDFARVFESVTNWEERELEKLYRESKFEELDFRLDQYDELLQSHAVLLYDILIKAHPHCIDLWLDRCKILNSQNKQNEAIATYVTAIRSVNPFTSYSYRKLSLANIWSTYAYLYVDHGDLQTASVIFSRAVKSQFKSPDHLAEIYIAWADSLLESSDETALKIIEDVLLVNAADFEHIAFDDKRKSAQERVCKSWILWEFYVDFLFHMAKVEPNKEKINSRIWNAFKQMSALQVLTVRWVKMLAAHIRETEGYEKETAVYVWGLQSFKSPEAQYYIWKEYLARAFENEKDYDTLSELIDRCLASEIPGFLAPQIFSLKIELELGNGKTYKAIKFMENAIEYLSNSYNNKSYVKAELDQIADSKFSLYNQLGKDIGRYLGDVELLRSNYSKAIQDPHLTIPNITELGLQFVEIETKQGEFGRVRDLFKYLTRQAHPDAGFMKKVWDAWEEFEVQNGTEKDVKALMRSKKQAYAEFQNVEEIKSGINPMGFLKSESNVKPAEESATTAPSNPDAIELDMDL